MEGIKYINEKIKRRNPVTLRPLSIEDLENHAIEN